MTWEYCGKGTFSRIVFNTSGNISVLSHIYFAICKCFQFGQVTIILLYGKDLDAFNLGKNYNLRYLETQSLIRKQKQTGWDYIMIRCKLAFIKKFDTYLLNTYNHIADSIAGRKSERTGRKHCRKRRNCLLRAISPFCYSVFRWLVLQTQCFQKTLVFSEDLHCRHIKTMSCLEKC